MREKELESTILIQSGEGETGTVEVYSGKRTSRAIKTRLTKERACGDRWAKAWILSHDNADGQEVYRDFDNPDNQRTF